MDHIGPEGKPLQVRGDGDRIALEQALALAQVAAVAEHEMAERSEAAGEVADEQVGPGTLVEALVGYEDPHDRRRACFHFPVRQPLHRRRQQGPDRCREGPERTLPWFSRQVPE
jgi:hypothetical protein